MISVKYRFYGCQNDQYRGNSMFCKEHDKTSAGVRSRGCIID